MVHATDIPATTLALERVVATLGGVRVLRGVDAVFATDRIHCIRGANGAGKSTILAVLGGRLPPSSGRVVLANGEMQHLARTDLRERVGWLGHSLGLYPELTVRENVAIHTQLRGPDPVGEEMWQALHLKALADRRVKTLSRGQQQRAALLRALVGSPLALLLDEPSTGLDGPSIERVAAVLHETRAGGCVVIVVTHDDAFEARLDAHRWRLDRGLLTSLAAEGPPGSPRLVD